MRIMHGSVSHVRNSYGPAYPTADLLENKEESSLRIDLHFDADFAEMRTACLVTKRLDQVL